MSFLKQLNDALAHRDEVEQSQLAYFRAFQIASTRAVRAENAGNPDTAKGDQITQTGDSQDIIDRLKESRKHLERQLSTLQLQLDKAQERARDMAEEQYLKTHVVHGLHDEVLALTMQLNLSEEKRKRLQDELGR